MPTSAKSAKIIPFEKDPTTMSELELFDYIQFLKRGVRKRAAERARVDPETLTGEVRESLAAIAESDREELAKLLPVEEELSRILGL